MITAGLLIAGIIISCLWAWKQCHRRKGILEHIKLIHATSDWSTPESRARIYLAEEMAFKHAP